MSELRYDGKVAIITGAGAGLGREYALLLGSRGAKVVVNDLGGSHAGGGASQRAADVVVDEIRALGGTAAADYNSVVDGHKIIDTAIQNFGRVDILINNAGILRDKSIANISDQDWNLVHDVHLKGSFMTTRAAWPYFKKQRYGRVIMTSSNSGIYGNFGQANYSSAKLGLVGLTNTAAIEGQQYNVHCNAIVPTAASRLTEGVIPDFLFQELKPSLIAPVVAYLCHESCEDNGSIIESTAGWATKVQMVRGKGAVLRTSLDTEVITPENVQRVWNKVTDMTEATHDPSMAKAGGYVLQVLNNIKEGRSEHTFRFGSKDLILYALGIGATTTNPNNLKFLNEDDQNFSPLPTFFIIPGMIRSVILDFIGTLLPGDNADLTKILHREQYIEIAGNLPTFGKLRTYGKVLDVMDKGSGAVVVTNSDSYDENGGLLVKNQSAIFVVGAGKFGGKKEPIAGVVPTIPPPKRSPDSSIQYKTTADQAAVYRLSSDLNPLHTDPNFGTIAGLKTPILHGLCSFGYSVRAVLVKYAKNDSSLFKASKVRFASPVLPGQTLKIDMWKEGVRVFFKTSVAETGKDVITDAYVDLKTSVAKL